MSCPDSAEWSALLVGRLSAEKRAAIEQHAPTCASCSARLEKVLRLQAESDTEATRELSSPKLLAPTSDPASEETLAPGTLVGRYQVVERIGAGGMGVVFVALDPELNRKVAIKLLRAETGESVSATEGQQRLLREAQAMARLSHPNVVAVYDVGAFHDRVFLAIEYVDGQTMRQWLREKPRSVAEVVRVFQAAGAGLQAAHDAGLIHRDFKPANVLLSKDGKVRVTDFGLARAALSNEPDLPLRPGQGSSDSPSISGASLSNPLTQADRVMGTPGYISPEQYRQQPLDHRSDQFAFCVSLYEALYGHRPFSGFNAAEVMAAVLDGRITPPSAEVKVPAWVRKIVLRGLSSDPDKRFASMRELLAALADDPREKLKRAAVWATVALALIASASAVVHSTRSRSELCSGAEQKLTGVWDAQAKAAAKDAFARSGRSYGAEAFAVVEKALDAYATDWALMHRDACETTRLRGEQTEEILAARMICLDGRLEELRALTGVFKAADAVAVDRAGQAVFQLSPVKGCADVAALLAPTPLPTDPAKQQEIAAVRSKLAELKALNVGGQYARAAPVAEEAMKAADATGYRPAIAEAAWYRGDLLFQTGKFKDAQASFTKAAYEAQASRRDDVLAMVSVRLAQTLALPLGKPEEGEQWLKWALATIDRMGGSDPLRIEAYAAAGMLEVSRGKLADAVRYHQDALELARRMYGAEHPAIWKRYSDLGASFQNGSDYPKAAEYFEAARRIKEPQGAEHPDMGLILSSLGTIYFQLGEEAKSRAAFERALKIREQAFGADNVRLFATLNNLADTLMKAGRAAEALPYARRAVALKGLAPGSIAAFTGAITFAEVQAKTGEILAARESLDAVIRELEQPDAPTHALIPALLARASVSLAERRTDDALRFALRAVEVADKTVGADSADLLSPLTVLAEAQQASGRHAEAIASLERAVKLGEVRGAWPPGVADAQFALAKALAATDASRAKQLAEAARAAYAKVPFRKAQAAEVEAFLAGK